MSDKSSDKGKDKPVLKITRGMAHDGAVLKAAPVLPKTKAEPKKDK